MNKIQRNEQGFSAIEFIMVFVIIVLIGAVGYFIYKNHHQAVKVVTVTKTVTKPSTTTSTSSTTNPYAGWRTETLQYEKITYQYPSNWTLTDQSAASTQSSGCVYPGTDQVTLTSPSMEQVVLHTGTDCIGDGGALSFGSVPVNSLGQKLYVALENNSGSEPPAPTYPTFACLAQTSSPNTPLDFTSRNIHFSGGESSPPANSFCYYPYDASSDASSGNAAPVESVSSIENSTDFATAKLIFESMKY